MEQPTSTLKDLESVLASLGPAPKRILIKAHPAVFDKFSGEFGVLTPRQLTPDVYDTVSPLVSIYVTKEASESEIEILELPRVPQLWGYSVEDWKPARRM